jgi:hypothetical protein
MRRGTCVSAAVFIAAALLFCCVCVIGRPAAADDDDEQRFILFSGRDIWRNGVFAHGGLLMAPGGFEQDGLMLKVLLSGGLYRYFSGGLGGERIYGAEGTIQVLPGWRIKRGNLEAKFFFGLDLEQHRLWPDDPFNTLQGRSLGLRMSVDLWYEPTPSTMAAMDATVSSIATNHSARAAVGWRVIDEQFYFGPEIALFASDGYRHFRLGGHFTAMKTGNMEWTAAGGWARDSDRQSSPYVRLGLMRKL